MQQLQDFCKLASNRSDYDYRSVYLWCYVPYNYFYSESSPPPEVARFKHRDPLRIWQILIYSAITWHLIDDDFVLRRRHGGNDGMARGTKDTYAQRMHDHRTFPTVQYTPKSQKKKRKKTFLHGKWKESVWFRSPDSSWDSHPLRSAARDMKIIQLSSL